MLLYAIFDLKLHLQVSPIIKLLKKLLGKASSRTKINMPPAAIIPYEQHGITQQSFSQQAVNIVLRLNKTGFNAYLVGGCIRDLLLGLKPKDFDVATSAKPEQIRKLFRNCRLIGRRFRLAHIFFGREIIEVATFRGEHVGNSHPQQQTHNGMIMRDNVYGSIAEDALRRDFTINALYYNLTNQTILDYSTGIHDLQQRTIRLLGNVQVRYCEDPVRMLRAIRFAAKLNFTIAPDTAKPIYEFGHLLQQIAPARLFDEALKLFLSGNSLASFELLRQYQLFQWLCMQANDLLKPGLHPYMEILTLLTFRNTDKRLQEDKRVTPAFIFAALLWYPVQLATQDWQAKGLAPTLALDKAIETVVRQQIKQTAIPKRFTQVMREIWQFQSRLTKRYSRHINRLLEHPRFRAAYDFLLLRAEAGEPLQEVAQWWTDIQAADSEKREQLIQALSQQRGQLKNTHRRKKKCEPI